MNINLIFTQFKRLLKEPQNIFFKNLGLKQTIAKNVFWLGFSEVFAKFLKFFLLIYIARNLGPLEYGKFNFVLAFVGLISVFSELGIYKVITREFAKDSSKEKDFPGLLGLKMILSVVYLALTIGFSFFATKDNIIRTVIYILGFEVLINGFVLNFYAFFRARQKMEYQAWGEMFYSLLTTGFGLLALWFLPSVVNLSWAYLAASFLTLCGAVLFFNFKIAKITVSFESAIWRDYLLLSWPIASSMILGSLLCNFDSVLMGFLGKMEAVGLYGSAQKILGFAAIPSSMLAAAFLPALSQFFSEKKEKLQKYFNYYFLAMTFPIFPLLLGGWLLSYNLIYLVYDPSFFGAVWALRLLLIGNVVSAMMTPFYSILFVCGWQKKNFIITFWGVLVNVILNLILVPLYSLNGAALASVLGFSVNWFLALLFMRKLTSVKPYQKPVLINLFLMAAASLIMLGFLMLPKINKLPVLLLIVLGVLVYSLFFFALKIMISRVMVKRDCSLGNMQ